MCVSAKKKKCKALAALGDFPGPEKAEARRERSRGGNADPGLEAISGTVM